MPVSEPPAVAGGPTLPVSVHVLKGANSLHILCATIISFVLLINASAPAYAQTSAKLPLVPRPMSTVVSNGSFTLKPDTLIVYDKPGQATAAFLASWLAPATGFSLKPKLADDVDNSISVKLDSSLSSLGDEGYVFEVSPTRVKIRALREAGLFYGAQTLRQLLPPAIFASQVQSDTSWSVPAVKIEDRPRFAWRGAMLDVCRHFMPKDFVLSFIDLLAQHKFNTFHWHLTDDQGWRIEIKKYPRLTQIGGWRKQTRLGHERRHPRGFDKKPHGGFYTQHEIREVVEYAKRRHITVVPEIEMPGHAQAAISAYPELGVKGAKLSPWEQWGINANIFSPSEKTILFMQDVLDEVLKLFPSKFIHVGGDEAIKDQWKASPEVQARIKELGLKDEHEMQSYFIKRMDTYLTSKGRRLIGWDEILEGGLAPGATVMSWRGVEGGITAAKAGHDVVMAPTSHTYFDYYQSQDIGEPLAASKYLPLEKVYEFEPVPPELGETEARRVLGAQGQLWSEYLTSPGHVEYMAFPRLIALSEVVWSPKERDYADFLARLATHEDRLRHLNVNFRPLSQPATKPMVW